MMELKKKENEHNDMADQNGVAFQTSHDGFELNMMVPPLSSHSLHHVIVLSLSALKRNERSQI
jgi:hypothetical protein